MLYGGGRFHGLERHPEIVVSRGYVSAAAGAYQFLPDTWKEAARKLRLPDFAPASQDQAALYLVEKRGGVAAFDRCLQQRDCPVRVVRHSKDLAVDALGGEEGGQRIVGPQMAGQCSRIGKHSGAGAGFA